MVAHSNGDHRNPVGGGPQGHGHAAGQCLGRSRRDRGDQSGNTRRAASHARRPATSPRRRRRGGPRAGDRAGRRGTACGDGGGGGGSGRRPLERPPPSAAAGDRGVRVPHYPGGGDERRTPRRDATVQRGGGVPH
jgi:hypothetical protein